MSVEGKTPKETADKKARKEAMLKEALIARINAHMALKHTDEAVKEVTALSSHPGSEGIDFVRLLLAQLDKELPRPTWLITQPSCATPREMRRSLPAISLAIQTPRLREARSRSILLRLHGVRARVQRIAGSLAEDPAEKRKLLTAADDDSVLLTPRCTSSTSPSPK